MITLAKRKIYFIIPSMAGGGAERVANILLAYLDRKKFDLKIILFCRMGEYLSEIPPDIEVVTLYKKTRWDFGRLVFNLRAIIKKEKPDALLSFLVYANIVTLLSSILLNPKPKIIISEHNNHRMELRNSRLRKIKFLLMALTYGLADKIIAVSMGIKKALLEDFRISENKIKVIYNPVDVKKIEKLCKEEVVHPFLKHNNGKFVIISAGRLTTQKNFELLIKAFALVRNEIPAYLIILGQGELKDNLTTLSKQLKVDNYVDFVGFQKNPYAWIKSADIFVLSSLWEGFPMVILETMVCRTAIVATKCPYGPDEIITNGVNGFLVTPKNEQLLAESILKLLRNMDLRKNLSHAGYERAEDFRVEKIVAQYEKIFEETQLN